MNIPQGSNQPDPYAAQSIGANWQQGQQGVVGQQGGQQIVSPSSPEIPARIDQQEGYRAPELGQEQEKITEKAEVSEEKGIKKEEEKGVVQAPEVPAKTQRFENPYKVFGYQASQQTMAQMSDSGKAKKGNISDAKSWLVVLLEKLLRVYKGSAYKTS